MKDDSIDFWKEITRGYEFIKIRKYDEIFKITAKLQKIKWNQDEKLTINALKGWTLLFAKKFKKLEQITNLLTTCEECAMSAWYRGLGYLLQGLSQLDTSNDNRFTSFSKAEVNYQAHINEEIPHISSPSNLLINTVVSTFFQGICLLEASGSIDILEKLASEYSVGRIDQSLDQSLDLLLQEILKAAKLQIKAKEENYSSRIIKEIQNQLDESGYSLYYCNIILRDKIFR